MVEIKVMEVGRERVTLPVQAELNGEIMKAIRYFKDVGICFSEY